jgi:hypothetical protein
MVQIRKRVGFDAATWQALHQLSLDTGKPIESLVARACKDLLKRHHRPVTLREALKASARLQPANDAKPARAVRRSPG